MRFKNEKIKFNRSTRLVSLNGMNIILLLSFSIPSFLLRLSLARSLPPPRSFSTHRIRFTCLSLLLSSLSLSPSLSLFHGTTSLPPPLTPSVLPRSPRRRHKDHIILRPAFCTATCPPSSLGTCPMDLHNFAAAVSLATCYQIVSDTRPNHIY